MYDVVSTRAAQAAGKWISKHFAEHNKIIIYFPNIHFT